MRVVFNSSNSAVVAAATITDGVTIIDPTAIQIFPSYGAGYGTFTFTSGVPSDLMANPSRYRVDNPSSPTTVLPKYHLLVTIPNSTMLADNSSSQTITITVKDTTNTTITAGTYTVNLTTTAGFLQNTQVSTNSGVATTTLYSNNQTTQCIVTATDNNIDSITGFGGLLPGISNTVSFIPSGTVNNPLVNNSPLNLNSYLTLQQITAPSTPASGYGRLYMKTGSTGLFWNPGPSGPEVNVGAGGSGSGNVTGPGSSTNNAIVTWSGTGGTSIQNTTTTLDNAGNFSGVISISTLETINSNGLTINEASSFTLNSSGGAAIEAVTTIALVSSSANLQFIASSGNIQNNCNNFRITAGSDVTFTLSGATSFFSGIINGNASYNISLDSEATPNTEFKIQNGYLELANANTPPTSTPSNTGKLYKKTGDQGLYWRAGGGSEINLTTIGGGNVTGAASSTANALVRFADTTGKVLANGTILESSSGDLTQVNSITGISSSILNITNSNNLTIQSTGSGNATSIIGPTAILQNTAGSNYVSAGPSALTIASGSSNPVTIQSGSNQNINITSNGTGNISLTPGGTVTSSGSIVPTTNSAINLGSTTKAFNYVYSNYYDSPSGQNIQFNCQGNEMFYVDGSNINVANGVNVNPLGTSTLGSPSMLWNGVLTTVLSSANSSLSITSNSGSISLDAESSITINSNLGIISLTAIVCQHTTYGLTATGTNQGTALQLGYQTNQIAVTASGTGVILPTIQGGQRITIINSGANSLNVYPPSGAQIDALGTNVAYVVATNGVVDFIAAGPGTQYYHK